MKRCSFCEWIPILPWPVWPLAEQCSLGQNVVVGSMLVLQVALGNVPRGVCLDPRLHYKCTSPRLPAELPEFVSASEFGTYLILRRFIWRGGEDKPHFLNLHTFYENDKLLVCSISNEKIASLLHLHDLTRVSKQLTKLENYGVVKRIRTGRQ